MKRLDWTKAPPNVTRVDLGDGRFEFREDNRVVTEWALREGGVSEAIIERVMRLNPDPKPYERLRGLHYKGEVGHGYGLTRAARSKGYIIRKFGRAAWERIPRSAYIKDGRRIWVTQRDFAEAQMVMRIGDQETRIVSGSLTLERA